MKQFLINVFFLILFNKVINEMKKEKRCNCQKNNAKLERNLSHFGIYLITSHHHKSAKSR